MKESLAAILTGTVVAGVFFLLIFGAVSLALRTPKVERCETHIIYSEAQEKHVVSSSCGIEPPADIYYV